jgi:hypothetical protein
MNATISKVLSIPANRARLVEAYLRLSHRTLNSLSAAQIRKEYRNDISDTIDCDPEMAERVAASFGL